MKVIGLIFFLLFNTVLCPEDEVMYLFKFHHFSANRCIENIEAKQAALKIMAKKPFIGIYRIFLLVSMLPYFGKLA